MHSQLVFQNTKAFEMTSSKNLICAHALVVVPLSPVYTILPPVINTRRGEEHGQPVIPAK